MIDDPLRPLLHRLHLVVGEQRGDGERCGGGDAGDRIEHVGRHGIAGELPDHRAQLEVGGEAQPVIDAPDVLVAIDEDVFVDVSESDVDRVDEFVE